MDAKASPMMQMAPHTDSTMPRGGDMQETNNINSSSSMMMVFNTKNFETMLYSAGWMITGPGTYAGSWLFLFFLAIIWRSLQFGLRRYDEHNAKRLYEESLVSADNSSSDTRMEKRRPVRRAWEPRIQIPRAIFTTIIQGIAYLLMIAVMTMNLGFFFAIITGFFCGELIFGHAGHHDFHPGP